MDVCGLVFVIQFDLTWKDVVRFLSEPCAHSLWEDMRDGTGWWLHLNMFLRSLPPPPLSLRFK